MRVPGFVGLGFLLLQASICAMADEWYVGAELDPAAFEQVVLARCEIRITATKKSGEVETTRLPSQAKSREECARQAKQHQTNFAPHLVDKIKVKAVWNVGG